MPRYVAFLGGINVGGHRVAMPRLKQLFEDLGFDDVSTYIASGNVVFVAARKPGEAGIEAHLERALGYGVPTFVRTDKQLAKLAAPGASPFGDADGTVAVGFLKRRPSGDVAALDTPTDRLRVVGTELWWHLPGGFSGSQVKPKDLAAAVGPVTTRNVNTVRKLAARLA